MSKQLNKDGKDYYTYISEQDISKFKNCANVWSKPSCKPSKSIFYADCTDRKIIKYSLVNTLTD